MIQLLRDDKVLEAIAMHEANPDMTDQLVHLIGERRRELVESYPTSVPMSPFRYWPFKPAPKALPPTPSSSRRSTPAPRRTDPSSGSAPHTTG
jgi:hypothetical protein